MFLLLMLLIMLVFNISSIIAHRSNDNNNNKNNINNNNNNTTSHDPKKNNNDKRPLSIFNPHSNPFHQNQHKTKSCDKDIRQTCKNNGEDVVLSYVTLSPYTRNISLDDEDCWDRLGIMQKIILTALYQRCGNCINIRTQVVENGTLLSHGDASLASHVVFPVFTQGTPMNMNFSKPLLTVPLVQLHGAMFIVKGKVSPKMFVEEMVRSVLELWPLVFVSVLLAFTAGVFMWGIDTWSNKEHFPRNFAHGVFDGFWWAFVSMTTVGYGDRVPISVIGRLFACFWILCGSTIMALLTAALTTAIATVTSEQRPTIYRGNIGILAGHSFEKTMLMKGNANIIRKENVGELIEALEEGDIDGILIDTYIAKESELLFSKKSDLYLDTVLQDQDRSFLGATVHDEGVYKIIREYVEFHQEAIRDFVYEESKRMSAEGADQVVHMSSNMIFTTKSGLFKFLVYTTLIILALVVVLGSAYECCQFRKTAEILRQRKHFTIDAKSLHNLEIEVEKDLNAFLKKWDERLLILMDSYSINGIFTKTDKTYPNVVIKITTQMLSDIEKTLATDAALLLDDSCYYSDNIDQSPYTALDGTRFVFPSGPYRDRLSTGELGYPSKSTKSSKDSSSNPVVPHTRINDECPQSPLSSPSTDDETIYDKTMRKSMRNARASYCRHFSGKPLQGARSNSYELQERLDEAGERGLQPATVNAARTLSGGDSPHVFFDPASRKNSRHHPKRCVTKSTSCNSDHACAGKTSKFKVIDSNPNNLQVNDSNSNTLNPNVPHFNTIQDKIKRQVTLQLYHKAHRASEPHVTSHFSSKKQKMSLPAVTNRKFPKYSHNSSGTSQHPNTNLSSDNFRSSNEMPGNFQSSNEKPGLPIAQQAFRNYAQNPNLLPAVHGETIYDKVKRKYRENVKRQVTRRLQRAMSEMPSSELKASFKTQQQFPSNCSQENPCLLNFQPSLLRARDDSTTSDGIIENIEALTVPTQRGRERTNTIY